MRTSVDLISVAGTTALRHSPDPRFRLVKQPLVSICVPIYNGAKFLRDCLDSIVAQTYENTEVLLIDDCSTDESPSIADDYCQRFNHFIYFRNDSNLGLVGNWIHAIQKAQGDWIKFAFQDDRLHPNCVERLIDSAVANSARISLCRRSFLFENDKEDDMTRYLSGLPDLESIHGPAPFISPEKVAKAALTHLGVNFYGEPTSSLYHRSCFSDYGWFNAHLTQSCDYEYLVRVGSNEGLAYTPETLAAFRVHDTSTSALNYVNKLDITALADPLILLHEYANNLLYENLRNYIHSLPSGFQIRKRMGKRVGWLCHKLLEEERSLERSHEGRLVRILDHLSDYPALVRRIRFGMKQARVTNHLDRHLLWRLKKAKTL